MKSYSLKDITKLAIKKYKIRVPQDKDAEKRFFDRSRKELTKLAQNNPSPGPNSLWEQAVSNGKEKSTRYFNRAATDQLLLLSEKYFCESSEDPNLRDLSRYPEVSLFADAWKEQIAQGFPEDIAQEIQLIEIGELIQAAYDVEHGDKPFDPKEYGEFVRQNASSIESEYYESRRYDSVSDIDLVPVSDEEYQLFLSSHEYAKEETSFDHDPFSPPVTTAIIERSRDEANAEADNIKKKLLLDALFDCFYDTDPDHSLSNDIFIATDPYEERWDTLYYLCKKRTSDLNNYFTRKENPLASLNESLSSIASEVTAIGNYQSTQTPIPATKKNAALSPGDINDRIEKMQKSINQLTDMFHGLAKANAELTSAVRELLRKMSDDSNSDGE